MKVNNDTRVYIHILIGALLIRLKSLHVKSGIFEEIWSSSETLQVNTLGLVSDFLLVQFLLVDRLKTKPKAG